MKHKFCEVENSPLPRVGDLIRSYNTADFINIVLEVTEVTVDGVPELAVRSVRYGNTNFGRFKLLAGKRSRSFLWKGPWRVVEEYTKVNNATFRLQIVASLKGVDTSYHPPADGDRDDDTSE